MRRFSKKQYLAAGAAAVIVASGAGVAFAYWTSTGTGGGTATTGSATPWAVHLNAATGGPLTPGGATENITFTVTNNSTGYQNLAATAASVLSATPLGTNVCDGPSNYAVSGTTLTGTDSYGDVAPGGVVHGTFTVSMNNLASSQDGCQGATVNVQVAAS